MTDYRRQAMLIAAGASISDKEISKGGYNLMLKSNFP